MPICAVCGKNNDTLVCKSCGFDGSCDYEKYPSLGRPAKRPDPVSRRRAALKAGNDDALRCPKCGSTQFSVAMDAGKFICTGCGHRFPMPGVPSKPQTPPVAKSTTSTPPPASKPAASTPPPASKPVTPTPPPVSKPVTPTPPPAAPSSFPTLPAKNGRGLLVRLTLALGWITAGIIAYVLAVSFNQSTNSTDMGPVAAFLGLMLIMQLRLHRKGFCPLFGSKIPYGLHNFCYIFMALDFTVTACVGFYFVTDSATQFTNKSEWLVLVALVISMPLYFAFWALGQRSSRKKK